MESTTQSTADAAAQSAARTLKNALLVYATEEQTVAAEFSDLLEEEQATLLSGSVLEVLPHIVDRKSALIARLSELTRQRERCLTTLGYGAGRPAMLKAVEEDPRLKPIWDDLVRHATQARARNVTNGMLVRTRLDYNQRALNMLRDACGIAPPLKVYGPDGRVSAYR
jgi:flagellar biosynthesis protein FlgN